MGSFASPSARSTPNHTGGGPAAGAGGRKRLLFVAGCGGCGCATLVVVIALGIFAANGGLTQALTPSPFAGDADFELIIATEPGRATEVMNVLVMRLESFGVDVSAETPDPSRIRLHLRHVRDGMEIANAILPVRALAFHLVANDQSDLIPPAYALPAGVLVGQDYDGAPIVKAHSREALLPMLGLPHAAGQAVVIERREEGMGAPPEFVAVLVEDPPVLTGADVADATVEADEWTGAPIVMLRFTESGSARFAEVTRANIGRKLAIVVDGESLSSPVIRDAITGGFAQVTMASDRSAETVRLDAEALAVALRTGALPAPCTLESVDVLR